MAQIVFPSIPSDLDEFKALPQASLTDEFEVAALTVLALSVYPSDPWA